MRRVLRWGAGLIVGMALAVQLVPYGRAHTNPPRRAEPQWDSPETRALAVRACYTCHSNETTWPWYTSVAPVSWLTQWDVDSGRRKLNFSEWDRPQRDAHEAAETVGEGEMPPWYFAAGRPDARLTAPERRALAAGLERTMPPHRRVARDD